jgi:hypothetical protein
MSSYYYIGVFDSFSDCQNSCNGQYYQYTLNNCFSTTNDSNQPVMAKLRDMSFGSYRLEFYDRNDFGCQYAVEGPFDYTINTCKAIGPISEILVDYSPVPIACPMDSTAAIIGGVVAFAIFVLFVVWCQRRQRAARMQSALANPPQQQAAPVAQFQPQVVVQQPVMQQPVYAQPQPAMQPAYAPQQPYAQPAYNQPTYAPQYAEQPVYEQPPVYQQQGYAAQPVQKPYDNQI